MRELIGADKIFTVVLVLLFLPITALAFSGGDGSEGNPYQISTLDDLLELADRVNNGNDSEGEYFKLMNDIAIPADHNIADGGWIPIGGSYTANNPFSGIFDGDGHIIDGVKINRNADNQGLFGYIRDGIVKDLGVENVDFNISDNGGGIVGHLSTTWYSDEYGAWTGESKVENCYVTGTIKGHSYLGGIAGDVSDGGTVFESYSTINVNGTSSVGGIAGYLEGDVSNSYSTGNVTGTEKIGGIAGELYGAFGPMYDNRPMVTNCYSTGSISGSTSIGGIGGYVYYGRVENCVALNPTITGDTNDCCGRISGCTTEWYEDDSYKSNYAINNMTVNGVAISDADKGLDTKNGADINSVETLTTAFWSNDPPAFDSDIWDIEDGWYPKLLNCYQCDFAITPSKKTFTASGGSQSVTITANNSSCAWTADESLDWVTLSKTSGTGSDSLQIIVAENTGSSRGRRISIANEDFVLFQKSQSNILLLVLPAILSNRSPH